MNLPSSRRGDRSQSAILGTALLMIFILSGFAGLIYQSIWSHYLGLLLGHAAYAQALVLAIFMGGMALGAAVIARIGGHRKNLVRGYALVELAIGLFGLVFHQLFLAAQSFTFDYLMPALGSPTSIDTAKWLLSSAMILPQSILLGMTFPLMSGGLMRRIKDNDGRILGGLYFTNSIGAAVGALCATFILLPRVGLPGTVATAAWLNIGVAFIAWLLATGNEEPRPEEPNDKSDTVLPVHAQRARLIRIVLIATTASAAASFVYEIIWVRMLALAVGSTLHAFELMLASFIAGLAFGGLWIRGRIEKQKYPLVLVGWMQVLMGLAALASLALYVEAFDWVSYMMRALGRSNEGYELFHFGTATLAMLIMMPAAFFAGTTLPLFTVTLLRAGAGESVIGRVYAWNTFGSIIGVFAAIHMLIPLVGLKLTLIAAAAVDLFIGIALLRWQVGSSRSMGQFALAGAISVIALVAVTVGIRFDPLKLASGVYRTGLTTLSPDTKSLFYRDGKTASVSVVSDPMGLTVIATNGKPDAGAFVTENEPQSVSLDEPTMVLAASLPIGFKPTAQTAAIIGFGSGLTTHGMLAHTKLKRVDTIEIEQAMVDGARWFGHRNRRAYTDARSNIVIDDAKSYFSGQQQQYDIIVSEPSNPWVNGVGALFSEEFYEFIPRHLTDDGVFVQWLQLYELDDALVSSVLKALNSQFGDYAAWLTNTSDMLIVATKANKLPAFDSSALFQGAARADLSRIGIDIPEQLQVRKIADKKLLQAAARLYDTPANSIFFPVLSLDAPRSRFLNTSAAGTSGLAISSLPVLELLNIRPIMPKEVPPSRQGLFLADQYIDIGRRQIEILSGRPAPDAQFPYSTQGEIHINRAISLRAFGQTCGLPRSEVERRLLLDDLSELAATTIPFLSPEELEAVYGERSWLKCDTLPGYLENTLSFLHALAQRDAKRISVTAQHYLAQQLGESASLDSMALLAATIAHIAQDQPEQAVNTMKEFKDKIVMKGHRSYLRALMAAYSDVLLDEQRETLSTK